MERKLDNDVILMLKKKKRRKFWTRTLSIMMCLVVFCTTYALILPAITMETNTFCGIEAHTHTDECFEQVLICQTYEHSDACYQEQKQLICTLPESEGHTHTDTCNPQTETVLICDQAESEGHTHSAACTARTETVLICSQEESQGHTHTETCIQTERILSCSQEESQGHSHSEQCSSQVLTCTLEEDEAHSHTDSCYSVEWTCGRKESEGHTHSDDCYTTSVTYVCGKEEFEGHTHSDSCYTTSVVYECGEEEFNGHTHSDSCYTTAVTYACGEEEFNGHTHTDACYEVSPGQADTLEADSDHEHTESCYEQHMICQVEEHEHILSCYSDPSADRETAAVWEATLPKQLSGEYAADVLAVAKSQIGYTESTKNYIVSESGDIKGYTRYGEWYGDAYGDWCAMFVSFCLDYAGVEGFPLDASCSNWISTLTEKHMYESASEYTPLAGDIIFFDLNSDGTSDHVGIVAEYFPATESSAARIQTIEGNSGNCVRYVTYNLADPNIMGYGMLPVREELKLTPAPKTAVTYTDGSYQTLSDDSNIALAAEPGSLIDMTNLINSVTVAEKINGTWTEVTSGSTVTEGDELRFTINYTVPGQTLSAEDDIDTLYYNLPTNITVVQNNSGNVYNDSKQVVGTFVIDAETKQIRITFNDEYVEKNANSQEIIGDLSFVTEVDAIFQEGEDQEKLIFNDKVTIDLVVQEAEEVNGDVSVHKTIAKVEGDTITYTIEVTSEEGTFAVVDLKDTMGGGIVFDEIVSVTDGTGTSVDAAPVVSEDKTSFTMQLPQMDLGGKYVITYQAKLPEAAAKASNQVNNKIEASSIDDKNNLIKDSSEVDYTFSVLHKWGIDDGNGNISWTIEVNKSKLDISGWTLSDTITDEDLNVKVVIKDSAGNTIHTGKLPYTFLSGSNDVYRVTYTTSYDKTGKYQTITNTAKLERDEEQPDHPIENSGSVVIGVGDTLKKTGDVLEDTLETRADGTQRVKVQWTVTIDTKDGPIGMGVPAIDDDGKDRTNSWYFVDKLDNDQYMTYDQLIAAVNAFQTAVSKYGGAASGSYSAQVYNVNSEGGDTCYSDKEPPLNENLLYDQFRINIPGMIPKNEKITFSYECWAPYVGGTQIYHNRVNFNNYYYFEEEGEAHFVCGQPTIEKIAKWPAQWDTPNPNLAWGDWQGESSDSNVNLDYDALFYDLLCWRIQVSIPSTYAGSLTVTEHLPEGLTISSLQACADADGSLLWMQRWKKDDTALYQGFQWYVASGQLSIPIEISDDDITFTVSEEVVEYILNKGEYQLYFYVFAKINDDAEWTADSEDDLTQTATFENNVTLKDGKGDTLGTDTQTQVITKDLRKYLVEKFHANETADNIVTYEVVLNKDGLDLDPTQDYLDVKDILTYSSPNASPVRVRLVPGTVELYTYSDAAGFVPTKITDFSYTYDEASVDDTSNAAVIWTNTLAATIPDGTPVKLVYRYAVTGKQGDVVKLDNECSIVGKYSGSIDDSDHMEFILQQPSATANLTGVLVYKVDRDNNGLFLPGAEFNLYMYTVRSGTYELVTDDSGNARVFVTDKTGLLKLSVKSTPNPDSTVYELAYDTAYKLEEIKAPAGYYLNPEPYEFYVRGSSENKIIPSNFAGHVLVNGDLIYYKDESMFTKISVSKDWQDSAGNATEMAEGSIEFRLFYKTETTEPKLYGTYTVTAKDGWQWSMSDLPKKNEDGEEYLYYVEEITNPGYIVTYNNDGINSGTISITNTAVPYALPETGGAGTYLYTTAGLLLMLASTAYLMYNKKRGKEVP